MAVTQLQQTYPLYLNNKAAQPNTSLAVTDKFTGEVAFHTALATPDVIDAAIAGAVRAAEPMAELASYEKQAVLDHCVVRFRERFDELAYALCVEAGKPIGDAEGEVTRLIDTFRIAAEEATRNYGEVQPLDISPRAKGYMGMWKRVPIGPCSFISPFNFPAQPRRAQDRARDRDGLSVRDEARIAHPARRDHHGGGAGRNRPARRRVLDPAREPRWRRPVHHRSAAQTAQFYGIPRGRLGSQGPGGQEKGRARTRR